MIVSQKVLYSFLLSALLCAGIAALALPGIFAHDGGITGVSAQIVMLVAAFLTSFLIIFFCFNVRRYSAKETSADTVSIDRMSAEAVQVEVVSGLDGSFFMYRQPFTFPLSNPELLQGAGNADTSSEVVYEQNGIHYINSNVFADEKDKADVKSGEFDNNFASLVESVVQNEDLG